MAIIQVPSVNTITHVIAGGPLAIPEEVGKAVGKSGTSKQPGSLGDKIVKDGKPTTVDLRAFLKQTGWPDSEIENAASVVWGESRGKPDAVNKNTNGSTDHGLFQINDKAHPETTVACAMDAECNSKAALALFQKAGWQPWYSSGCTTEPATCRPHAPANAKVTYRPNNSAASAVGDAVGSINPLAGLTQFMAQLFSADTWLRVGKVLFGGIVLIMAMEVFLKRQGVSLPKVIPI